MKLWAQILVLWLFLAWESNLATVKKLELHLDFSQKFWFWTSLHLETIEIVSIQKL